MELTYLSRKYLSRSQECTKREANIAEKKKRIKTD
uniref:Uncharacterized protein n=1 Tax=Arundo donax TaxID=35708 RepID=A0A0A8Z762_ARUDO